MYCGYSSRPAAKDSSAVDFGVDGAWEQPQDRVHDHQRGNLAAREHVIADRHLEVHEGADSLVDALVAGAEQDQVRALRQVVGARLPEDLAARVQQNSRAVGPAELVQGSCHRLRAQDHARSPAVGVVVDGLVAAKAPMAHVVDADLGQAASLNAPRNALGKGSLEHGREEREQLDLERRPNRLAGGFDVAIGGRRLRRHASGSGSTVSSSGSAPRRPSASPSITISPRAGANTRTTDRTSGTSSSPAGPDTTMTSAPPAR